MPVDWNAVIGVATVLGVLVAFVGWQAGRRQQRLSFGCRVAPLVEVNELVASDVEVRYQGQPVSEVGIVSLTLVNTGREKIVPTDFSAPLEVSFATPTTILDIVEPDDVRIQITRPSPSTIQIAPLLLNRGVALDLWLLVSPIPRHDAVRVYHAIADIPRLSPLPLWLRLGSLWRRLQRAWRSFRRP